MTQTATHTITVHGASYPAFIDPNGNVRFVYNPIIQDVIREMQKAYTQSVYVKDTPSDSYTKMSLNKIHKLVDDGQYSHQDLLEFYISIGYSIKYLKRLPEFENTEFIVALLAE